MYTKFNIKCRDAKAAADPVTKSRYDQSASRYLLVVWIADIFNVNPSNIVGVLFDYLNESYILWGKLKYIILYASTRVHAGIRPQWRIQDSVFIKKTATMNHEIT